jgi:hypothetical protein
VLLTRRSPAAHRSPLHRWWVIASLGCSLTLAPTHPLLAQGPARQIDHILIQTPHVARMKSLLVDTLGLPLVWPQPGDRWQGSTGIAIGDVSLELFGIADTLTAFVGSLAIEAVDFGRAHQFLEREAIGHGEPSRWPPGDSLPPSFTTMGVPGMGIGVFFIRYETFDMSERRRRYDAELRERGGGSLGLRRIKEVQVRVDASSPGRELWRRILGMSQDAVWRPSGGPAVRLTAEANAPDRMLIAEVASITSAAEELTRLGIGFSMNGGRLRIDPLRLYGLVLELEDGRHG